MEETNTPEHRLNVPEKDLPITPTTREEIEQDTRERIHHISKEFQEGFSLVNNYQTSVSFFGSARFDKSHHYYQTARSLAHRIVSELGYTIVTGGGPGIMEAANRGAKEAGGASLGLGIDLPNEQALNEYVTDYVNFHYFFVRKVLLAFSAEAYVFFPGGFGTHDEFFELITLVQTKKIAPVPLVCVGSEYWNRFDSFIHDELAARQVIDGNDVNLYTVTDTEQ